MTNAIFDKALELVAVGPAITATGATSATGVAIPVRFLPTCDWVIHVTSIDAANSDETYVFSLEVSNVVGGTYTQIAEHTWPRAHGTGKAHIPINGDMAAFLDTDSAFMRTTLTQGGTSPSMQYGSYLAKAANGLGIARRAGDIVTFP